MPIQSRKLFRTLAIIFLVVAFIPITYVYWLLNQPLSKKEFTFTISKGQTLSALANKLKKQGLLQSRVPFVLLAKIKRQTRNIKIGEYRLKAGSSTSQLLEQIISGKVIQYKVVLIEGWNFKEYMAALHKSPKLKGTLKGKSRKEIMRAIGYPGLHPEGRFFPDTYQFTRGMDDVAILKQAYRKMKASLDELWPGRDPGIPIKTPYDALILASIIEKETGRASERRTISAVFINRLRIGMRLQTDPTVIYGMGKKYDGNIRLKDLRTDTPYNTYTRYGLPPTPIAMPSRESIYAALHPSDSKAIYFVGRGDGSHQFSRTLREHNKAVIKYQLGGRPRSWPSHSGKKRK
ncbi:MAG TPA: endolytic transglycosylase MltG [Acidiferrobacteraceae bacterium]|jgi:peptidoglycan lytic transglycosylase G|nr:endolytic transglycosylase MltG [Acidiferrobacteraceae bacterium]HEX19743.1 endolytic transglycosylase MltG [Acidiferrobacteraceae bacterium]